MKGFALALAACGMALAGCKTVDMVESDAGRYSTVHDAKIRVFMSAPTGPGPFPAVILMHGCSGLDWGVERGMARHTAHLVDAGFVTLVVDSFTPRGIDTLCSSTRDMVAAYPYRQYDAVAAMRWLREQSNVDPDNIFLMGQSHGGSVAVKLAGRPLQTAEKRDLLERNGDAPWFRALVAYYPWCPHVPRRLDTPLLVLSGEADEWTPPIDCVWHKAVVKGAPYEVVVYEGAHHSFDLPISLQSYIGYTVGGNAKAAADSRQRMVEWFREHME